MHKIIGTKKDATVQEIKQIDLAKTDPVIYPFSANPDLEEGDLKGLDVYKRYLESAFDSERVHDIAIVGRFGIGKSSIIQSFESQYLRDNGKEKNRFLYITLGNYKNRKQNLEEGKSLDRDGGQVFNDHDIESNQSVIERRIILQIYSRFRRNRIPESGFNLIQEHDFLNKASLLGSIFIILCTCLYFYPQIKELELPLGVEQWVDGNIVYMITFIIILILTWILSFIVIKQIVLRWRLKEATIKLASTIEAKCEQKSCEGYIDQHATEILYCLERIAEHISYTIVFEDMDRLNSDICVNVLMILKELNYMINTRLRHKEGKSVSKTQMRFIYVVNDEIILRMQKTKFADYILTVFPNLNMRSAPVIFEEKLRTIDNEICNEMIWGDIAFDQDKRRLIYIIGKYISDYRIYYAILNDYSLLFRLFINNGNNDEISKKYTRISNRMLAFAVYKNVCPSDYYSIWTDKSDVFPKYNRDRIANEYMSLIDELVGSEGEDGYLSIDCLYYAGFPKDTVVDYVVDMLEMSACNVLLPEPSIDSDLIRMALSRLLGDRVSGNSNTFYISSDIIKNKAKLQNIRAVLIYILKNNIPCSFNWIINERNSYIGFMDVIDCKEIDENMQIQMYEQFGFDRYSDQCIFDIFSQDSEPVWGKPLTNSKIEIYIRGCGRKYSPIPSYDLQSIDGEKYEIVSLIKSLFDKES